ncbi:MAG: lysis system i-spanin subunit Rz [Shewanella sp.]|uniref:lysis system i-spanin subunit Rz n=1 Tax=Aeromonas popoffii TaxID=70856 RepID=UPI003F32202A
MNPYASLAVALLLFGSGLYIGHDYTDKAMTVKIGKMNESQRNEVAKLNAATEALEASYKRKLAEIDATLTGEAENARMESEKLRSDLADGTKRLLIATKRASSCKVPAATNSASVGDAERTELDDLSRQDYFSLRDGIKRKERQLEACQSIIESWR